MNEKTFNGFLIGRWKCIVYVIKVPFIHDFYFVYVVEAFITLD
jgi:hypothetical protein